MGRIGVNIVKALVLEIQPKSTRRKNAAGGFGYFGLIGWRSLGLFRMGMSLVLAILPNRKTRLSHGTIERIALTKAIIKYVRELAQLHAGHAS